MINEHYLEFCNTDILFNFLQTPVYLKKKQAVINNCLTNNCHARVDFNKWPCTEEHFVFMSIVYKYVHMT